MGYTLGVDKTKGGWCVARLDTSTEPLRLEIGFAPDVAAIAHRWPNPEAVGIDIPLYLVPTRQRAAETELRGLLGPAARSLFASPTTAALSATSQAEATERNRANGGPGISAQAFGLFAAIREARAAIADLEPDQRGRWVETHPESAFVVLAEHDGAPPLGSKRSGAGVLQRIELLQAELGDAATWDLGAMPNSVRVDDVFDAVIAAWSARRWLSGTARLFGSGVADAAGWQDLIAI